MYLLENVSSSLLLKNVTFRVNFFNLPSVFGEIYNPLYLLRYTFSTYGSYMILKAYQILIRLVQKKIKFSTIYFFVAMETNYVISRDAENGNHVTPVIFQIPIIQGTHINKKFACNTPVHTKVHTGLRGQLACSSRATSLPGLLTSRML